MLEKPAIEDETIMACLRADYGLPIQQIVFLPVGGDQNSAVYRAEAAGGAAYFCKLRQGHFDGLAVELPQFLSRQGVEAIIAPLDTLAGRPWALLGAFRVILYPFITGQSGFDQALDEPHWAAFGRALRQIHETRLPAHLLEKMPQETYSGEARAAVEDYLHRLETETFTDPVAQGLAEYLLPRQAVVREQIALAGRLAGELAADPPPNVPCHADIHPGNLFLDTRGGLFIVDWDYPVFAPKERDLMFIGGGQGYVATTDQEEETRFYRYYGPAPVHRAALAYYRCERNLIDLTVECGRIFAGQLSDQDRAMSLQIITWLFLPGGSIEMACKAVRQL